jgi:outer membrane protein TolC
VRESIEIVRREKVAQDLVLKLVELYVDVLFAEKRQTLARQKLARGEEEQKLLAQRIKNPAELRQKQLVAELDSDDLRQEATGIDNSLVAMKEQLARLTGLPRGMEFALRPEIGMKELELKLSEVLGEARRTNPGIVTKVKAVDLANEELAIRKGKDHTTLDFQFDYGKRLMLRTAGNDADVYTASLVFAWDVYDGGRNLSEQREGKEKREQAIAELEVATQELEVQIRRTFHLFEESRRQAARSGRWIQTAQENLRAVQEKADTGALPPIDLLDAKIQLQRAIVNRDRALGHAIQSRARLYHQLGQLSAAVFQ